MHLRQGMLQVLLFSGGAVPKRASIRARVAAGVARIVMKRRASNTARLIARYRAWSGAPSPVSAFYRVCGDIAPTMEPVPGEWVGDRRAGRVLLYVHGGAFVACSPSTHRPLTVTLTKLLQVATFVPRYPLAPEYPFPGALKDAMASRGSTGYTRGCRLPPLEA